MAFNMEITDIDLGDTSIENIFINDFMPMADGTYVKVYLLGYRYANDVELKDKVTNETIAKQLDIPLIDVLNAWDFWEDKKIIKKNINNNKDKYNYSVEFVNLKQLYINNVIKPSMNNENSVVNSNSGYTCSSEDLIEAKSSSSYNKMFEEITYIIRRPLDPNECKKIIEWTINYNMSPDVIIGAYKYANEKKNKRNIFYIQGIIKNWFDEGITTIEAMEQYFANKDIDYLKYNKILNSIGLKGLTNSQKKIIDKWFNDWNFSLDMILRACDETIKIREPNLKYVDGILENWYKEGIKTLEDVENRNIITQNTTTKNSNTKKFNSRNTIKTKFHNFEQRTSKYSAKELEDMVRWKFKKAGD
ncbi:DnaD domain-containing protein [Clostridiisalibacter paucivorans]|uniref:DnaD domain-containing protein n=1 Tax=Clostridiisalibacter paucivorans TaxID=408753 RepID=UPI00047BCEA3|nr:DnaD domain protein [Clostridiisalibacter paucivorans]